MKIKNVLFRAVVCAVLVVPAGLASAGSSSEQPDMSQILDMMKGQGMDEKTQKQMEQMFKGMSKKADKQKADKLKREQEKFAAENKGHGTAQVEVEGKRYELTVTKCEITDRTTGHFLIQARQRPGHDNVTLGVNGGGGHSSNHIGVVLGKGDPYEEVGSPTFQWKGKTLEWAGKVAKGNRKDVPLKFKVACGAEMKDYAAASKPKPKTAENVVTFQLGQETHTFQAGHCSTKEYRTGNLMVQFEATATGKFRGRPAILLMTKSHPHGSVAAKQAFQNLDLYLGELTAEERVLPPLQVAEQLRKKLETFGNTKRAAIKKKYDPKMAAYQEKFDTEMPALKEKYGKRIPPEKTQALMEPFNKLSEAQNQEHAQVRKQVKAMRYPTARSNGPFTLTGQSIHYGGSKLRTQDGQRAKEFRNLTADPELWVTCGK